MSDGISKANKGMCLMYGHIPHIVLDTIGADNRNTYTYCERCGDMIDAPHDEEDSDD